MNQRILSRKLREDLARARRDLERKRRGRCSGMAFHGGSHPRLCWNFAGYGADGALCWIHAAGAIPALQEVEHEQ